MEQLVRVTLFLGSGRCQSGLLGSHLRWLALNWIIGWIEVRCGERKARRRGWKRTPWVEHALDDLAPQRRLAEHHELEPIARHERDVLSLFHDPIVPSSDAAKQIQVGREYVQ